MNNNKKICSFCGHENNSEKKVCESCGVKLSNHSIGEKVEKQKKIIPKPSEPSKSQKKTELPKIVSPNYWKHSTFILLGIVVILIFIIMSNKENITTEVNNETPLLQNNINLNNIQEITNLENQIVKNSGDTSSILKLANLYHDSKMFDKAILNYEKYIKINDRNLDAVVDLGVCFFDLKQYENAEKIFLSVATKNPAHQVALLNLGVVNLSKGDREKSKEWFEKCIKVNSISEFGQRAKNILSENNLN